MHSQDVDPFFLPILCFHSTQSQNYSFMENGNEIRYLLMMMRLDEVIPFNIFSTSLNDETSFVFFLLHVKQGARRWKIHLVGLYLSRVYVSGCYECQIIQLFLVINLIKQISNMQGQKETFLLIFSRINTLERIFSFKIKSFLWRWVWPLKHFCHFIVCKLPSLDASNLLCVRNDEE